MRNLCVAVFVCLGVLILTVPAEANSRAQGWCENGNYTVSVPGGSGPSANRYQRSFPSCTINVFNAGTVTLATIYSDNLATPTVKANPFTASTSGQWFFYAQDGRYDVQLSGAGISVPFTIGDVVLFDERTAIGYNVRTYGATGNGTTVDDTAFTNAITAARADSKVLYIPAGTYRITSATVFNFVNNGSTNDSGFSIICEAPGERWRSGFFPVRIDYRGATQAIKLSTTAGTNNLSGFTIKGCQFDGRNITGTVDGLVMQANAGGGDSVEGVRIVDSAFTNFPRYQVYAIRTVFDISFLRTTFHNAQQAADNVIEYEYDGVVGAASQWTFDDCWIAPYTAGKWGFFAGRNAAFPVNAISDVRFTNGTVTPQDNVNNVANGANGIWVYGGLTITGTHFECPSNAVLAVRQIGIRYTGSLGGLIAPAEVATCGTGIELGNSGNEVGGVAVLTTEALNAVIPIGVGLNNNNCRISTGSVINCADIRVVQTGSRRATLIQANSSNTTSGSFGTLDGQPRVLVEPAFSTTTCTNATPIQCTTTSAHGKATGDAVIISEVAVNTAANAPWRITVTGATTFTLDGSIGNGAPTANTGLMSSVSNDVMFTNYSAASGGISQTGPFRYDAANRSLGVNVSPALTLHMRTFEGSGFRIDNSSNSNRVIAQILSSASVGTALLYDSTQTNNFYAGGDGTLGVGTGGVPTLKMELRTANGDGFRLTDSSNANGISAQLLNTSNVGQFILYDSTAPTAGITATATLTSPNILFGATTFVNLPASTNGTILYCSNCTIASPCAGAGTGAFAKRLNGAWVCN